MVSTAQRADGLRILAVEDDWQSAEMMALLLRLQGHRVDVALDGPAALRAAAATRPDVVLLDIGLPGMDGFEVARRLSRQEADKRPLVIAVTGYGGEEERRQSREAGIDLHLVKPVDPGALERVLRRFQEVLA